MYHPTNGILCYHHVGIRILTGRGSKKTFDLVMVSQFQQGIVSIEQELQDENPSVDDKPGTKSGEEAP
jgi:hypothetical protein